MFCCKCENDLVDCTCADLEERLAKISENPVLSIAVEQNRLARKAKQENINPKDN